MSELKLDWVQIARQLSHTANNVIDGDRQSGGGPLVDNYGPRDGQLLCQYHSSSSQDVDRAVASARRAFEDGRWSKLPPQRRKDALQRLASLIEANLEQLALLESLDVGKPISESLSYDVPAAAAYLRFCAEAADKFYGPVYSADSGSLAYQLHRPVGVVAGIVGWNFPLYLAAMKIGAALATGNCLILKPSELTPLSATRLAELALEAGVPEGVLNVVHGTGSVGEDLARHFGVNLLTFTGSSRTGKRLLVSAGESNMKRLLLECGGKAPDIVFEDAPSLERVADALVARAFYNQGQVCSASTRLLIQDSIKDELLRRVIQKTCALIPGDPLQPETRFGALVSRAHQEKVLSFISLGESEGARIVHRGTQSPPVPGGYYVPPTIFDRVTPSQRIAQEEIFGPVLSVLSFRDEPEALSLANSTTYGLSATVWTRDLGRAHRMSQGIESGFTVINATGTPTGGPGVGMLAIGGHKESGIGTEGGIESLKEYVNKTAVVMYV
jgi:acyl-CoA reductase-like NAD-dependent aldehyde dehydrogenase